MINTIYIAFDDADGDLGHFFQACADTIRQIAFDNGLSYEWLDSNKLTKSDINHFTEDAGIYLFAAFSHGSENALWGSGEAYIEANNNLKNFYNSVLLTFACLAARGFQHELESTSIPAYFGYREEVWASTHPDIEDVFVKCAIKGVESFIMGNTIEVARKDTIIEYDKHINECRKKWGYNNPISAALLKNKQALVTMINNDNKTINE